MDFFQVGVKESRGGALTVYPDYIVGRSKDLMVRGKSFYAIWDPDRGMWSTDEYDAQRLIDRVLLDYAEKHGISDVRVTRSFSTNSWNQFKKYVTQLADNSKQLDEKLTFANTEVKKEDYVSRRLPYNLAPGDHSAWDELIGTLYKPEEKAKIEWAIGSIVAGDSKKIQKFLVLYGPPGYGKGTVIEILLKLFEGYYATFDAKSLTGNNNSFALESFRSNPLVAIQHDGDLSKIEDNTQLNSIISHELMRMNEKHKPTYSVKVNAFLFMGTNHPVKISDAKSGLIRRLIDVQPSGDLIPPTKYHALMSNIDFQLGPIAHRCLEVYNKMGRNFYSQYRPLEMMLHTDIFFNFIEANHDVFTEQDGVSLRQAFTMYREYCESTGIDKPLAQYKVREQLKNYFEEFKPRHIVDGSTIRSYFLGFKSQPFKMPVDDDPKKFSLVLEETTSLLNLELAEQPAQTFKTEDGKKIPAKPWSYVKTTLSEIDPYKLHFVKIPERHIVIDFDLKNEKGEKDLEKNLAAASEWPPTYAEISQGGAGVHLHYIYDGDVTELAQNYAPGIEVKTLLGDASLRRKLTKCNNVPIATINSGLPFKEKKVLKHDKIRSEKGLRKLIERNLRKEIHPGTKPSIDFIYAILEQVYKDGLRYDVSDMRQDIVVFANNSTNQPSECLKIVNKMRFKSEVSASESDKDVPVDDDRLVFFDLEVYPNLFVVCWKYEDAPKESTVRMINPSSEDIEKLFSLKLVGFFNRRYDNHILYARYLGYSLEQLYRLSKKITDNVKEALFAKAYSLSYADVYDYISKKQSLKKYQIELGLVHKEMDIPWDEPVPEDRIMDVVEYCVNDVVSTEETHKARRQDYVARQILAELSGLTINDTTQRHTTEIIFEGNKNPQREFVYTDLSKQFPGYEYSFGKSTYQGITTGEGGYVYAEPGIYSDVVILDVASMHPTSIIQLNLFGDYTKNFKALVDTRLAIKHGDYAAAREFFDGKLKPYLENEADAAALSDALKIAINIVYGLTSAKFDNAFRDIRNKDNIVAKRGALFMIDLKKFVEDAGFQVVHIKTDSIKVPGATPWLIEQIMEFGASYGYDFEHEATYERFCLVNDAVYIARVGWAAKEHKIGKWEAVGAQFQHPYIYKTLFTGDEVSFKDMCETKQVQKGAMYLDFEGKKPMALNERKGMHFVGKTGRFVPVREGFGGGILYRVHEGKQYAVAGSSNYEWVESHIGETLPDDAIEIGYFEKLADKAVKAIEKFGSFEEFVK